MAQIPLDEQFIGLSASVNTTERRSALINAESQAYTMQDIIDTVGGGLEGTSYVYVAADGTDVENAAQLQAAYSTAQGMSPSATNRITVIAAPGNYDFGSTPFVMDAEYIDLVSLDGNTSIIFNSNSTGATISITANDVFVKGVNVLTKNFTIANSLNLLKVEDCKGGYGSFGGEGIASGTFINCTGGTISFGGSPFGGGTASGTFINCTGGTASFGGAGTASGTFINCTGGGSQFGNGCFGGGFGGIASGTFSNCVSGSSAFGGGAGTASGIFTNCTGGDFSFGVFGTLTGKLYYCRLTSGTFETVSGAGITRLCLDGSNVENNQG
jgi:hypothetical protein